MAINAIPRTLELLVSQNMIGHISSRLASGSLGSLSSSSPSSFSPKASMVFSRLELFRASNMSMYFWKTSSEPSSSEPSSQSSSPSLTQASGMTCPLSQV